MRFLSETNTTLPMKQKLQRGVEKVGKVNLVTKEPKEAHYSRRY